jgi:ribonucleoside-diphosphate reductase alpha chain
MISVVKNNGKREPFDAEKINEMCTFIAEGLAVSPSAIAMKAQISIFDGIHTRQIQKELVDAARDLATIDEPDYLIAAGRLMMSDLRKQVYGQFDPLPLYDIIYENTSLGRYDKEVLELYTKEEIDFLDSHIVHERDMFIPQAAALTYLEKYLIKDKITGTVFETPQVALMMIPMCLLAKRLDRLNRIIKFYEAVSTNKFSLPSPIMAGVRSPTRQFSSCCLIDSDDDLDAINATANSIVKYASKRAGIGVNGGRIRAQGSPVRGGEISHTGCINFYKMWQAALHSCSQGGLRNASATLFYPWWHYEVEDLLVLKNNKGTESNRVRHIDYGFQMNKLLMERVKNNEMVSLFSPHENKELYEAFFTNQDKFDEIYYQMENNPLIRQKRVKALDLFTLFINERAATGRIYANFVDHMNDYSGFDCKNSVIYMSNLCVAPETQILTDNGYIPIAELEDQNVSVWNGEEFTETVVRKTGSNQKLLKVITDSGQELYCTPYHKFYVFDGYGKDYVEKRAHELTSGMKLAKFDLPVLYNGTKELPLAYQNGFYSGDGCAVQNTQRVYLYGEKRKLAHMFDVKWSIQEEQNRQYGHYHGELKEKYFVPMSEYTLRSRINWLAGWLDADGCVYRNGDNQQLVGTSVELSFLKDVQLMLQTLGVSAKIKKIAEEGYRKLPLNNGTGEYGDFWCQTSYRLIITSNDVYRLLCNGLKLHRLQLEKRLPQRDARRFVVVESVVDNGRVDDTFCFTESKRGMAMFNGILTGQCLEIGLPTSPIFNIHSPAEDEDGEIALCTLAAYNLGAVEPEEFEEIAYIIVEALDELLDYQDYPVNAAKHALKRRSLGIGVTNYQYWLAKNGFKYSTRDGNNATHELFERLRYSLMKASVELAKEKGQCEWFYKTKLAKGIMPVDNYKKDVDALHTAELKMDWTSLRQDILKYGMRNSTLMALMPSETSAIIANATNGIEPQRGPIAIKAGKDGNMKIIVPEYHNLKHMYEFVWDIPDNTGYIEKVAIMQKFTCQAISSNLNYDPFKYNDRKVPLKIMMQDIFRAYKYGFKTIYYHNTRDKRGQDIDDVMPVVTDVVDESTPEVCDGCAI